MDFLGRLAARAREARKRIVLPEGTEPRTVQAAARAAARGIARITLLGRRDEILTHARETGTDLGSVEIVPVPHDGPEVDLAVRAYLEQVRRRGVSEPEAREHVADPLLWGALQVAAGRYDGMVAGARSTTAQTLRAALRGIGMRDGVARMSSFMLMVTPRPEMGDGGLLVFADCGVNPDPSARELAEIAVLTAESAASFLTVPPRVALLSFSNFGNPPLERMERVRDAVRELDSRQVDFEYDGEMQANVALDFELMRQLYPFCRLTGAANVLLMPALHSAAISAKLLQQLGGGTVYGPILCGLAHAAQIVQTGATVSEIVTAAALASLGANAELLSR